tara:strand:+ start:300 stop:509 length:210 start_codon:yes stop_codon:yes gene_type:complete
VSLSHKVGDIMGSQKLEGFKISEISELARLEFEKKKNSSRNHLGRPNKKIEQSVMRQLNKHKKLLKNNF